jgi:hypothetical protein
MSDRLRAGAREVYMTLRRGARSDVDWDDISRDHQDQFVMAFEAGLAAWKEHRT